MYNRTLVGQELKGLVGLRQPFNTDYQFVDSDNQSSASGLYLDDFPFFKAEYFVDSADTTDNTELNTLLDNIKLASINNVLDKIFYENPMVDQQTLYTYSSEKNTIVDLSDGLYGFLIEQNRLQHRSFKINKVTLEFDGTGDITLYLKHTRSNQIIAQQTITITSYYQVETLNWQIDNIDYYKGEYFLGYIYDDTLKPYERENMYMNCVGDLSVHQVYWKDRTDLDNLDTNLHLDYADSIGLNLDISVYKDFTRFIIQNKNMFAKALQMQICSDILNRFMASNRSNINERYSRDIMNMLLVELRGYNNNGSFKKGLEQLILDEISMLSKEIEKLRFGKKGIYVSTSC